MSGDLKSKTVYLAIREAILAGDLEPGCRLSPGALASRYGTSSLPVREALWMLSRDGLVSMQNFVGARVREYNPTEIRESLFVRGHLEGLATMLATPQFDDDLERELMGHLNHMRQALNDDPSRFARHNDAFHSAIFARCPNTYLRELIETVKATQIAYRTVFRANPDWQHQSLSEHKQIVSLMRAGDASAAGLLAAEHKSHLGAALIETFESPLITTESDSS